ncbi:glycosyltransferase family protein [Brachybacterium sp. AOP42-B2-9]|uniref:glycosyltransferase family protein n=1 Tax=Brachybacterium sp. AOP42-B2-9 TaxID=3457672 RepID=UPI004033194C
MTRRILIYGDVNLNYRDGSGAWLEALTECLLRTDSEVHVLLKADVVESDRRAALDEFEDLVVHTPFDDQVSGLAGMKPRAAASRIAVLDRRYRYDIVISRGFDIAAQLAISSRFTGRMWPYLTEGAAFAFAPTEHERGLLDTIAEQSRRIFLQTEEARSIVESLNDGMTGKTLVMNPIIPDAAFRSKNSEPEPGAPLEMVYAGKFARLWNTLEMTQLPSRLAAERVETVLSMVGDKFQGTGPDTAWLEEMKAAAATDDPRVRWHGGLPRARVLDIVHDADLGMCWRDAELDASPEISTKMLECSALGTPPLLNRTTMHEQLLGADYPLFIDDGDVLATVRRIAGAPQLITQARSRAQAAVQPFSMEATVDRFRGYFARAEADPATAGALQVRERRQRIVVAGHDFKFASDLIETLQQRDDIDLRIDKWHRLASHDKEASLAAARWADTVICEWSGPNAVFYAKHLPASARLIVRFHGFEVRGRWIKDLDPHRVDAFVFISDFYRRQILRTLGWPEHRSTVIHNTIDAADLDRPKLPGAQFRLGMAGYVPFLKRPDRAVDLLRLLLRTDDRFHLHLRGRAPWNYQWEWRKPAGQDAYRAFFREIANDPQLRRHVIFEPFSPDMGNWFRRIGWMTSPSSRETFHLAPVEGMASGAPALVWDRDGATEIFGPEFVRSTTEELAEIVLAHVEEPQWRDLGSQAQERAGRYDFIKARDRWFELLSLPKGAQPPLHGESLLAEGAAPQNRAEALVALHNAFERHGAEHAAQVLAAHPDWLEPETAIVTGWRRLTQWAEGSSLPPTGVAPLYQPRKDTVLAVGLARKDSFTAVRSVPTGAPKSVGAADQDVLLAVDAFTRAAIRERASAIVARGPLTTVLAACLTARRLGLPWFADSIQPLAGTGRRGALLEQLHQAMVDEARPTEQLTTVLSSGPAAAPADSPTPRLGDLQIGLIADEFTRRTISTAMPTVELSRTGWPEQLEGLSAVLVESAWEGRDHEWFHGIAYHGEEEAADLWNMLAACRERGIPVLFWNKEDPVHFRSFALAASRTDHVFTTDADRLPAYLSQANRNLTASSLPFFAEPRIHNPLPTSRPFTRTAAFAGTYYGSRYPQRSEELRMILETAAEHGLTIYDRQKDRPDSPYQMPQDLQPFSVGSVPYEQVLEVYKSHPVNLNVNSVSDSPSMFSRRVVEIAASGSVVASGAGRGVREALGPEFPVLESAEEWRAHLTSWFSDENARLRSAWGQMRTVLRTHRADQSLVLMLRTAGIAVDPHRLPDYGWVVESAAQVESAAAQTLTPVVITQDETLREMAAAKGLRTATTTDAAAWITATRAEPAPTHFEDLLLATLFVDADVLSARTGTAEGAPLIAPGLGAQDSALWRSHLNGLADGEAPWAWRMPGVED